MAAAEEEQITAQVAICWQAAQDYVSTALCGVRTAKEAEEDCAAFDTALAPEHLARIDQAIADNIDFGAFF